MKSRLSRLQVGNPQKLVVIDVIPGEMTDEAELHRRFRRHRKRGEWFKLSPEIVDFIKEYNGITRDTNNGPKDISNMTHAEIIKYMMEIGQFDR